MKWLENTRIRLRAMEPEDLDLLHRLENDSSLWVVGSTLAPLSLYVLRQYIEQAHEDIYVTRQLRLMVEEKATGRTAGMIDLYDFDPHHRRANVGIVIVPGFQQQGFGFDALTVLAEYACSFLHLHQLYAHIPAKNLASLSLFRKAGFEACGTLKDWLHFPEGFMDVVVVQKIWE